MFLRRRTHMYLLKKLFAPREGLNSFSRRHRKMSTVRTTRGAFFYAFSALMTFSSGKLPVIL